MTVLSGPLVSVLIPTFNRSRLLMLAIESVLSQHYENLEIIVVDNNSTDDTEKLVGLFNGHNIIYVKNKINIGAVHNYNRALQMATGKYIHFFSDDDIMLQPDCISFKVAVFERYECVGLVHSDIQIIDDFGEVTYGHWASNNKEWLAVNSSPLMGKKQAHALLYDNWIFISMPSVMVRKSILDEYRIEFNNQLKFLVDWDMWLKISLFGDFYFINQKLISYRNHSKNESKDLNMDKDVHFLELMIAKLGLVNLYSQNTNQSEVKMLEIVRSTKSQLKWLQEDNKILRPVKNAIKKILKSN